MQEKTRKFGEARDPWFWKRGQKRQVWEWDKTADFENKTNNPIWNLEKTADTDRQFF